MKKLTLVTSILLFIGIAPLPYSYYQLLRIVVTITAVLNAINTDAKENYLLKFCFVIVAVVFNPVFPIHLNKEVWMLVDFFTAIFLLVFQKKLQPKLS